MNSREFNQLYPQYKSVITAIARKLARRDAELVHDLEQEGAIALWKMNPKKATSNRDAMIRQALKFRMIDALRRLNPRQYKSLDTLLAGGAQLEANDEGDLFLHFPKDQDPLPGVDGDTPQPGEAE